MQNDERLQAVGNVIVEWKCLKLRRLTLNDVAQLERHIIEAPLRLAVGEKERWEAIKSLDKRSLGSCIDELNLIENVRYILWLAARHESPNITEEDIGRTIMFKDMDELKVIIPDIIGLTVTDPTSIGGGSSTK